MALKQNSNRTVHLSTFILGSLSACQKLSNEKAVWWSYCENKSGDIFRHWNGTSKL